MSELEQQLTHQIRKLELELQEAAARHNVAFDHAQSLSTLGMIQNGLIHALQDEVKRLQAQLGTLVEIK